MEEDDVNLEELDLLSSYYADQENDPDFEPNPNLSVPKKMKKANQTSIIIEKSRERKLSKVELKCQLCDASFSRVIALRRHFLNDHEGNMGYQVSKERETELYCFLAKNTAKRILQRLAMQTSS